MCSKFLSLLIAVSFGLVAESAVAGPDWQLIEKARTARKLEQPAPVVDHGPHAQNAPRNPAATQQATAGTKEVTQVAAQ